MYLSLIHILWGSEFAENLMALWTTPDRNSNENKSGLCRMPVSYTHLEIVSILTVWVCECLFKPLVLVRTVIDNKIHND